MVLRVHFSIAFSLNWQISVLPDRCPPKVGDNQYFIFYITTGYLLDPRRNLAGGCPELSATKIVHRLPQSLKIKIYIPASRSVAPIVATNYSFKHLLPKTPIAWKPALPTRLSRASNPNRLDRRNTTHPKHKSTVCQTRSAGKRCLGDVLRAKQIVHSGIFCCANVSKPITFPNYLRDFLFFSNFFGCVRVDFGRFAAFMAQ